MKYIKFPADRIQKIETLNQETKEIEVKEHTLKAIDLLKAVLGAPRVQGMTIQDMRERYKALDLVEAHTGDVLALEDAEHAYISRVLTEHKFPTMHKLALDLMDAVEGATAEPIPTAMDKANRATARIRKPKK